MAYQFKRLSEIEMLDAVPEGANALAEVDGVFRRVSINGIGGTIPEFDLTDMGLPVLHLNVPNVSIECDTTELRAALDKSAVKLRFIVNSGMEVPASGIMNAFSINGAYQCSFLGFLGNPTMINFNVNATGIYVQICTLAAT